MERGESGISEIISTVLVIILVIALTAVIGAVVLGWAVPVQKTAYIVTQATPVTITKASVVQLFMSQGESVSLAPATTSGLPIKFSLTNGSATYNFIPLPGVASQGWKPGTPLILFRNASGSWITDSTASIKNNTGFSNGTWTVTIIDANSNALIAQHNVDLIVDGSPVPVSPPVASFFANTTTGCLPITISFIDSSTGAPTLWSWNFGDGTTSTLQNPVTIYTTAGNYNVSLAASNACGNSTPFARIGYITVGQGPVASFTTNVTSGAAPLNVKFNDQSTGSPATWSWTFGDGGTSTQQSPEHLYTTPGTYNISLTETNGCGSNTLTKTGYIMVAPLLPGFTIEAWVKWNIEPDPAGDNTRQYATIAVDGNTDVDMRYHLQHNVNNSYFEFAANTSAKKFVWSTTKPQKNTWYYLVGVYNQTTVPGNNLLRIHVNGTQEKTVSIPVGDLKASPNEKKSGGPLGIIWQSHAGQRKFEGNYRGLTMYERAMSPAEVDFRFATGLPSS